MRERLTKIRIAQKKWSCSPAEYRQDVIQKLAKYIAENAGELIAASNRDFDELKKVVAEMESENKEPDTNTNRAPIFELEHFPKMTTAQIVQTCEYYHNNFAQMNILCQYKNVPPKYAGINSETMLRVPCGVIGIYNEGDPLSFLDYLFITLITGNALIFDGYWEFDSEYVTFGKMLHKFFNEIDPILSELVTVLNELDADLLATLISVPDILDKLFFCGSPVLRATIRNNINVPYVDMTLGNNIIYIADSESIAAARDAIVYMKENENSLIPAYYNILINPEIIVDALNAIMPEFAAHKWVVRGDDEIMELLSFGGGPVETPHLDFISTDKSEYYRYHTDNSSTFFTATLSNAINFVNYYGDLRSAYIFSSDESEVDLFSKTIEAPLIFVGNYPRSVITSSIGEYGKILGIAVSDAGETRIVDATSFTSVQHVFK
jgi:gamma-glutamyl phosphate reductase